jgi:hypothetical protein
MSSEESCEKWMNGWEGEEVVVEWFDKLRTHQVDEMEVYRVWKG